MSANSSDHPCRYGPGSLDAPCGVSGSMDASLRVVGEEAASTSGGLSKSSKRADRKWRSNISNSDSAGPAVASGAAEDKLMQDTSNAKDFLWICTRQRRSQTWWYKCQNDCEYGKQSFFGQLQSFRLV